MNYSTDTSEDESEIELDYTDSNSLTHTQCTWQSEMLSSIEQPNKHYNIDQKDEET